MHKVNSNLWINPKLIIESHLKKIEFNYVVIPCGIIIASKVEIKI
jgi:hypothetical protein